MSNSSEKRKALRIRPWVSPCVVVEGSRRLAAYFTDLSVRGARISTEAQAPAAHARVVVEVRLAKSLAPSRVPGQVKWVKPVDKGYEFGLTFVGVTSELQKTLQAVVEEFRRLAETLG